jgi:hypothetical protein
MLKSALRRALAAAGYEIRRTQPREASFPADATAFEKEVWKEVQPFTMTSFERVLSLVRAVQHVEAAGLDGAIVECGVWRGGSMMAVARTLLATAATKRDLYLFDTFEGMPAPGAVDVDYLDRDATELLTKSRAAPQQQQLSDVLVARSPLEQVRKNLESTAYPGDRLHFERGLVEETIPGRAPDRISLLRLDTDWYASTRHELEHLYPRLVPGGVLIIDDYGHWRGARRAVDEYFARSAEKIFLTRIDYTGRLGVKR